MASEGDCGLDDIVRDPEYDLTPPVPKPLPVKKGRQCGECGLKVKYYTFVDYHCPRGGCPMGFGS